MSTLGWIAVPGGRVDAEADRATLRVLIVPRLTEQLTGAVLTDWPAVINAAEPVVEVQPAGQPTRTVPSTPRREARSDAWRGFFGHGIGVTPWQPPAGYRVLGVDPTLQDLDAVRTTYRAAANKPGDPAVVRDELAQWQGPPDAAPVPPAPEPVFTRLDFHRAVSLLREHPFVLRMLGLIVEFDVPVDGLPRSENGPPARVRVRWPESPIPVESPWTLYEFDGRHFLPASAGDIRSGFVDLSDEDTWDVITLDVHGGVDKLRNTARVVLGDADEDGAGDGPAGPDGEGPLLLPTLKSAGLQLVRKDRARQLQDLSDRGAEEALADRVFAADDLVLGYRIDVRPQNSNTWFSLHARTADYAVDGEPVGPRLTVEEEGHLKPHAVLKERDGVRTDQVVAQWSGWSLAAPRPAFDGARRPAAATAQAEELVPYRFTVTCRPAKNSLPELRFGRIYQLRARVADIAGGGLDVDDRDADSQPTGEVPYTRWEPVPPPELTVPPGLLVPDPARPGRFLVDAKVLGPGGTLERLVVRTTPRPDGSFRTEDFDGDAAYPANDRRTLSAPPTTFQLAEQHGVFSGEAENGRTLANRAGAATPDPALPDPMALGVAATVVPEPGGPTRRITDPRPWAGNWPDLDPKRIELAPAGRRGEEPDLDWVGAEAGPAPVEEAEASTVRITVPPGERVLVELSSTILLDRLDWFEIRRLVTGDGDGEPPEPANPDDAEDLDAGVAAAKGRHPMLTPPHRLELVHAVRRPLDAPTGRLSTSRVPGDTYAVLAPQDPTLGLHTPSTAQLELRADWDEWSDAPDPVPTSVPLPPLAVARGAQHLPEIRQEFGDTRHRNVRYTATAVSRYRDCFAPTDPEEGFRASTDLGTLSLPSTALPAPPRILSTVPAFAWSDASHPEGGLLRERAAGRLRVELGRPWFTTGEGEQLAVVLWPGAEEAVPDAVRPLVSWLNRDPIHPAPAPRALADASMFAGFETPAEVPLVETGDTVRVLPYPVFFDDGHWYADIEMPAAAASSYAPFVHLALARYQRASLAELSLSQVVRTEMVPLLPDRSLAVHQEQDALLVTLTGLGRAGDLPNRVFASVERCDAPDVPGAPVELTSLTGAAPGFPAWVHVPGATVAGRLDEPLPRLAVPPGRVRLLVREVEEIAPSLEGAVHTGNELSDRTVYVATVPLPVT
ncbi:hypothetical protein ACFWIA_14625 [Streptomyces sp. NPDC127068]|uniref:hypothetical protein n=1 Tax=Streptomyces sp. NPDC127068 TaxID=3347127 RepID=UPI00365D5843